MYLIPKTEEGEFIGTFIIKIFIDLSRSPTSAWH